MPSEALERVVKFHTSETNSIRHETNASRRSYTPIQFYWNTRRPRAAFFGLSSEKPDATVHGNSTGNDKEQHEISQDAKDRGNREAHEILMITDTVQCKSCHNKATPGHSL